MSLTDTSGSGSVQPIPVMISDSCIPIAIEGESEKSGTGEEEGWVMELTRVCGTHLPPDHPCLEYLKGHGFDLGTKGDLNKFTDNPSPLRGRRWYLSASVRGRTAEFLIDSGASHSVISKKFYSLLSGNHDDFKMKVNACTADGSRMRTYGRTFMRISIEGKEFVFSPTIAEISDDGILGLDFAALFGAVLDPAKGVLRIEHPYGLVAQCVLRQVSSVASVVQTRKIPPGTTCDVMFRAGPAVKGGMAVVEPDTVILSSLGLESADVLVSDGGWSVMPISNPSLNTIHLPKGTKVAQVVLAEAVTSSRVGDLNSNTNAGSSGGELNDEKGVLIF